VIIKPDDIILSEILSDLHLDHLKRDLPLVFEPMRGIGTDNGGFTRINDIYPEKIGLEMKAQDWPETGPAPACKKNRPDTGSPFLYILKDKG